MLPTVEPLGRVVICEDDEVTRELLCENLAADRYEPLAAPTASDALRLCRYSDPDLLLLDLALPDASGLDVLREIRGGDDPSAPPYDPKLGVIVLTGRGADDDRVRGLKEGADDYLVKPFHYPELLERIRNLLSRRSEIRRGPIRVGELRVDAATREVRVGDCPVTLANKEFAAIPLDRAV
jgi:DNA-binding response OmpR family regulator